MDDNIIPFERDLFEVDNARNLTTGELVRTFVPTDNFWRLISSKNQIILGSRGSGKTALAKMVSHSHLSRLDSDYAKKVISGQKFIGLYVSTKTEWVGALKNKGWQSEEERERFFQWKMNISTCLSLLVTLKSCLKSFIGDLEKRVRTERQIIVELSKLWSHNEKTCHSIKELEEYLDRTGFEKNIEIARRRALGDESLNSIVGIVFDTGLFQPLRIGIKLISESLGLTEECAWLLAVDETENLDEMYHRILNSEMRADPGNLFFKITTMPYCHYTLNTNMAVPLEVNHDFEYVYIDQDDNLFSLKKIKNHPRSLVETIFRKRVQASGRRYEGITVQNLLGQSKLLDSQEWDFSIDSKDMKLLETYASEVVKKKASEILQRSNADKHKEFKNQIGRKVRGILTLRDAISNHRGNQNLDIYSGVSMAIACADANPRRLIRLYNKFLKKVRIDKLDQSLKTPILPPHVQNDILISFSQDVFNRFQNEEGLGPDLHRFIQTIGEYMKKSLHENPIAYEQISSIRLTESSSELYWGLVKRAIGLGILYHNVNMENPNLMPEKEGTFRLAYALAPYFKLLPRKGDSRRLESIVIPKTKKLL